MPAYSCNMIPQAAQAATHPVPPAQAAKEESGDGGFFSELLDIVNPLQHLPVIGTIYRAVTGEHIDDFARIAGDSLYGGLWGAVGAVADVAFEAVTGKSAEDTVLAWFDSDDTPDSVKLAANLQAPHLSAGQIAVQTPLLPTAPLRLAANVQAARLTPDQIASQIAAPAMVLDRPGAPALPALQGPAVNPVELAAFTAALADKGVSGPIAQRALYAYRQSIALAGPVTDTVN